MATDEAPKQEPATSRIDPLVGGKAPMIQDADGRWLMELAGGDQGIEVVYERAGGILKISGIALVRHAMGDARQPVTIVVRQEDAKGLGGAILGRLQQIL